MKAPPIVKVIEVMESVRAKNPGYEISYGNTEDGPNDAPTHYFTYYMGGEAIGQGDGSTQQAAKRDAAMAAWKVLYRRSLVGYVANLL